MTLPTRRAVVALAALAPLGLLGYASPAALDALLLLDALLFALVLLDSRLAPEPGALDVRRIAALSFSVGREAEVGYEWRNPTGRAARLLVREIRPAILGGAVPARAVAVPRRGAVREDLVCVPARRGKETEGWLAVRSVGPLGLGQRQIRLPLPWSVTVYPSMPGARLRAAVAEATRRKDAGLRPARRLGEGRLFESLREWVPGDDTRTIDWKATARRGKVIARQYEEERRQQVLLVLDAGRLLTAEVAGISRMEHIVRAALDLAFAAHHHDDNVGVMVFADQVLHYVAPQRGRRGLRAVLDVLAVAEPRLVESDYPGAFRYLAIRNRKRALTVFLGDIIDRWASEALVAGVASLRPRHLPLAVTLRDPELDAVASGRPATVADAYRKAAAEELLAQREDALAVMRRSGVVVLDVPPARAGAAAVGKYLELKRRGRL